MIILWLYSTILSKISTHWGRVTHICVGNLTIIGSDNGLSLGRRQSIIWTNPGILLIGHLGTNFNEILLQIYTFSFTKMHLKLSSGKWPPFCLGLNVLTHCSLVTAHGTIELDHHRFRIVARRRFGAKPLLKPMLSHCQLDPKEHNWMITNLKDKTFHSREFTGKKCL